MADVQPFHAIRYNAERFRDLSALICPPYDIISPQDQLRYLQKSPYNMIRLEFGEGSPDDTAQDNRYTRAAATLDNWLRDEILVGEQRPAFYLIEHRFSQPGDANSRFSLIARVRLEDFSTGVIRPHEATIGRAGADRLNLLRACRANFSPVMALFRDKGTGVLSLLPSTIDPPVSSAIHDQGVGYALWLLTDEEVLAAIQDYFVDKTLYIADGHHRYQTALAFQQEERQAGTSSPKAEASDFVMMSLTDAYDPGLVVEPTHRLVRGLNPDRLSIITEQLSASFDQEVLPPRADREATLAAWLQVMEERGKERNVFGLYGVDRGCLRLLMLERGPSRQEPPSIAMELDVSLLHRLVFEEALHICSPDMVQDCLDYTRDASEAISRVESGVYQLAFLLNPTPVSRMLDVADQGMRMPQKSTYFHPKTPAGLAINPLWIA
ncbi:MAG: DUF1015 domain-containing protein [Chloroflexota bacterium]